MKQFGAQFINNHLMPLMQKMLEDAAKAEAGEDVSKRYLSKLFVSKKVELTETDKTQMEIDYFGPEKKSAGVPFIGEEESKDRKKFLDYFVQQMVSSAGDEAARRKMFLPVITKNDEGEVTGVEWPGDLKRNLFLMSYGIAERFEQSQINTIIDANAATGNPAAVRQAKDDKELLKKGMLMLVKDPATGDFTRYIRAGELKPGDSAVAFLPVRSAIPQGGLELQIPPRDDNAPDQVSSSDDLTNNFYQKRGKSIADRLEKLGFTLLGDVQFDGTGPSLKHAFLKVKSGDDTLLVSADIRIPFDQNLNVMFTFQGSPGARAGSGAGAGPAAGTGFGLDESKLAEAFTKADGSLRTARDLYNDIDLCRTLDVKRSEFVQRAPSVGAAPHVPGTIPQAGQLGALIPAPLRGGPAGELPKVSPLFPPGVQPQRAPGKPTIPAGARVPQMPLMQAKPAGAIREKIPGIPAGTVMAAKAQRERQEAEAAAAQSAAQPPVVRGIPSGAATALTAAARTAPAQKSNFGRNVAIAHILGIGSALGGGLSLGSASSDSSAVLALSAIKIFFIALGANIHHFFG